MNENIKKFFEKVAEDLELQKKFAYLSDPEEAYKFAASVQEGFTRDEFVGAMKSLYENSMQDMSEEDLGKVAGGFSTPHGHITVDEPDIFQQMQHMQQIDWSKILGNR